MILCTHRVVRPGRDFFAIAVPVSLSNELLPRCDPSSMAFFVHICDHEHDTCRQYAVDLLVVQGLDAFSHLFSSECICEIRK